MPTLPPSRFPAPLSAVVRRLAPRRRAALAALGFLGALALGGFAPSWRAAAAGIFRPAPVFTGDTVVVFGPKQYNGSSGQGQTYVDAFTTTVTPGRLYSIRLINGAPDGTHRASKVVVKLNGFEIVSQTEVTQAVAELSRPVAITEVDTLRVTVAGSGSPYATISILSTPDNSFNVHGPTQYAVTSGSSTTHSGSFSLPTTAGTPHRIYVVNGASDGTQRVTSGSVTLNGTQIVTTSELTSAVGSLTKVVTLNTSNTLDVTVNGSVGRYVTVRVTATDTTKPSLMITAPAPNALTNQTSIAVSGTISDQTATTVTVNGVTATVTANTSYTATVPLNAEGTNLLTVRATDAGGRSVDSTRTVIRDTQAPSLGVSAPADGAITKNTTITVSGTASDANGVTVNTNGTPFTLQGDGSFSGSIALSAGPNVLTTTATDGAGNTTSIVRTVTQDAVAPTLTVTQPADGSTTTAETVVVSGTVSDATTVTATDAATNQTTVTRTVTRQVPIPPDPSTVASTIDPTIATTVGGSTAFLYTGADPIQTGVAAGTIVESQAGVFRGKVVGPNGAALSGASVTVAGHPEFGRTVTRTDGRYDLAVNAGAALTLDFTKSGYLPSQRTVPIEWQQFVEVDSVALLPIDANVTTIGFTQPIEVARGSVVTDPDGTRQATLLFEQGTQATMVLPNGTTQPLASANVRVTEYTAGTLGEAAMPGTLPPTSAYTYAAELTIDQALSVGAKAVQFSKPVAFYLDNFLDFPVGTRVPYGWYDRTSGRWVAEPDGRVIRILSVTGGRADLDVSGSGQTAPQVSLDSLGITDAERERLATLYAVGKSLWRTEHSHVTSIDWNAGRRPVSESSSPTLDHARAQQRAPACINNEGGSIIGCQTQTLGEVLAVAGTPFALYYDSERVPGRRSNFRVVFPPLVSVPRSTVASRGYLKRNEVPDHALGVAYALTVAGRTIRTEVSGGAGGPALTLTWDGKDAYGRTVNGKQRATASVTYDFEAAYSVANVPAGGGGTFGTAAPTNVVGTTTRAAVPFPQSWTTVLGSWDARGPGMGGWTLDAHHGYDPVGGTLYLGNGAERDVKALGTKIELVKGTAGRVFQLGGTTHYDRANPTHLAMGPDGSLYVGYGPEGMVRRLRPDGSFVVHATLAVNGVAAGLDGSVYASDRNGNRVRRVAPDGTISVFAGTGSAGSTGDGGVATSAAINAPGALAAGPDGSVYIAEENGHRIRRVGPDGIIRTLVGTGQAGYTGDGGDATQAKILNPAGIAAAADGSVYFTSGTGFQFFDIVRRVGADGIVTRFAGRTASQGGPLPALQLQLGQLKQVAMAPDGAIVVANGPQLLKVEQNGNIAVLAGQPSSLCSSTPSTGSCQPSNGNGGLATQAYLGSGWGVATASNGVVYLSDHSIHQIRALRPVYPWLGVGSVLIASEDGRQVYEFDASGKHRLTRDAVTSDTLLSFTYGTDGRLAQVRDAYGNVTTIERDGAGRPTAIVAPFGQRTVLAVDGAGYLSLVTAPDGAKVRLYHGATGLLDSLSNPRGRMYRFAYDADGYLVRDEDPAGGAKTLVRTATDTSYGVALSSPNMGSREYRVMLDPGEQMRTINTGADGLVTTTTHAPSGTITTATPDGVTLTRLIGADQRLGMQAPVLRSGSVRQPSGLTAVVNEVRRAVLSDSFNIFSVTSLLDSVALNGQWTVTDYAPALQRYTTTTPEGRQSFTTVDSLGRVRVVRVPGLDSVTYRYDSRGRLDQVKTGGRVASYTYDVKGRLHTTTDPLGRTDSLFYDDADRLTRQVLWGGRVVQFAYDSSGNLTSVTPPGRPAHSFNHTAVDLDSVYTPPSVGAGSWATEYRYNLGRQLTELRRPDGANIGFGYETTTGRPNAVAFDRGTLTMGYSPTTGQLTSLTAPGGIGQSFTYDGMLPTTVTWTGPVAGSVGVGYNADFRVTSQTVNGANSIVFGYDRDGLLTAAGGLGLKRASQTGFLERDSIGATGSHVLGVWGYDPKGALQSYSTSYTGTGGGTLFQTSYVRDSLARITELTETVQGTTSVLAFTYDSAGRLETVRRNGTLTATYRYDQNGNRLDVTTAGGVVSGSYDAQDRLTSYGSATYTYTQNGELRTKTDASGTTTYTYDGLGNLTRVQLPAGTDIEYLIDAQNRRIGKKVNGALVHGFLRQGQLAPAAELDGSGAIVSRFVYATRVNVPDYLIKGGQTYRLILDHLGSVRLVVNTADGTVAQRLSYDEFGQVTENTAQGFQPFGYAGGCTTTRRAWCGSARATTTRMLGGGPPRTRSGSTGAMETCTRTSATIRLATRTRTVYLAGRKLLRSWGSGSLGSAMARASGSPPRCVQRTSMGATPSLMPARRSIWQVISRGTLAQSFWLEWARRQASQPCAMLPGPFGLGYESEPASAGPTEFAPLVCGGARIPITPSKLAIQLCARSISGFVTCESRTGIGDLPIQVTFTSC